jgi:hypothetical protein
MAASTKGPSGDGGLDHRRGSLQSHSRPEAVDISETILAPDDGTAVIVA